ncbi:large-conductance mechanosensitive channel protein MscL [Gordonia sp. (in: high G+C Gram-positive bacteria)]|uniref:large-conductance mechanosensitive channel protein MscL n=1 Tax=Gordonia sp. (in: high G+C Gram-positive bacteria) TaxID=84139 RepID=UPI003341C56B
MLKGFKDFLMRGNVVELATAVIIGAAFTAIVTAFTEKIVNPLIASIPISTDYAGLGIRLRDGMPETFVDFGAVITALINFVIVAAVVYFLIVMPYNKLSELRKLGDAEVEEDEVSLLTEIRDLLDPTAKERKAAETATAKAAAEAEETRLRDELRAREDAARFDSAEQPSSPFPEQPQQPNYGQPGVTQQFTAPPQAQQPYGQPQAPAGPPSGGFPTPNPAPGQYPPPGNLPPGQYAPGQYPPPPEGGQFPQGQFPNDGPRHSR